MRRAQCFWLSRPIISEYLFPCPRALLTIACSYHSILRDARHEDLLRQQFATQNERLNSLERVVASGNLALLERIQAPESQQLVHVTEPTGPLRLALAPNDNKGRRTFDERQKRTWSCKVKVSLPLWLVNRVWEFGLREAEGGWTAQLHPIMMRPYNTYVFDFVYSGDVDTVRRLLSSGQLSVRDHSQDWDGPKNLLQVGVWCSPLQLHSANSSQLAASCGKTELCRFLLQQSAFFHDDKILLGAFTKCATYAAWNLGYEEISKMRQRVEDLYHLFVSENYMEVDFRDGHQYGSEFPGIPRVDWRLLLSLTSVRGILNGQSVDFDRLPFQQRFSTAVESTGWPAEIFLSIFRHDNPASLVTAATENGTTALHWAAAHLGAWVFQAPDKSSLVNCFDEIESYRRLVVKLIRMGADLHALNRPTLNHADPFVSFLIGLSNWWFDQNDVASAVCLWGQIITESGHSLEDYANTENLYLAEVSCVFHCENDQSFIPVSVAVNDDSILQVRLMNVQYIEVWRACPMETPGA